MLDINAANPKGKTVAIQKLSFRNRDEWLAERRKSIGASDLAAVLGHNPWHSPLGVFASKVGADVDGSSEQARWGLDKETAVAKFIVREHLDGVSLELGNPFTIYRDDRYPWLHATPDFFLSDGTLMQVKCVGSRASVYWHDGPPIYVLMQCNQEMLCTDSSAAVLAAEIAGDPPVFFEIERNEKFIDAAIDATKRFWGLVESGIEPEISPENAEASINAHRALHPEDNGMTVDLGELADDLLATWEDALGREKDVKAIIAYVKGRIGQLIGDNTYGVTPAGRRVSYKTIYRGAYEVKASTYRRLQRLKS